MQPEQRWLEHRRISDLVLVLFVHRRCGLRTQPFCFVETGEAVMYFVGEILIEKVLDGEVLDRFCLADLVLQGVLINGLYAVQRPGFGSHEYGPSAGWLLMKLPRVFYKDPKTASSSGKWVEGKHKSKQETALHVHRFGVCHSLIGHPAIRTA